MENTALISVVIPTRSRLEFLREAVASVQAQSFVDWELIVVDDCSEDGTWDWIQTPDDKRIRPLRMERHGERSVARNTGLRAARGEFVIFLDDDDWLLEGALARLSDALRREPTAIAAVGANVSKNDRGAWKRAVHPRRRVLVNVWPDVASGWTPLPGEALLRRSILIQSGGWNESPSVIPIEDYELWLRLSQLGPAVLIPQPVLAYRLHPGQSVKSGTWKLSIRLCRKALAGQSECERQKSQRRIRARRFVGLAHREYRDAALARAAAYSWHAVWCAPSMLRSPMARALVLPLALRCSGGAILGRRGVLFWRKCRRALREQLGIGFSRHGQNAQRGERRHTNPVREA